MRSSLNGRVDGPLADQGKILEHLHRRGRAALQGRAKRTKSLRASAPVVFFGMPGMVWRSAALLIVLLSLWAAPAFAQGCAMCYSTAAATSKDGQRAIDKGVAILLAPPLGVMTLGVGMAFRYGRKRDQEQNRDDSAPIETCGTGRHS